MKEWLEIIRETDFFNLLALNTEDISTSVDFDFETITGNINVQYNEVRPIKKAPMPKPPNFIAVSDVHSHVTQQSTPNKLVPHAVEPAPAQRAGNVAFIWGDCLNGSLRPYREDGFPAVVLATGLAKYYQYGIMTRKGQHPAIKAERLAALWFDKDPDECYRNNGPASISFECYKEFWIDGEFKGQRWADYTLDWKHRILSTPADEDTLGNFLGDLKGTTNMFSDVYFPNEVDELCYMTDFA
jgi:hypothetical protein